ncbi:MAG: MlaD family protein [Bacteroidetes bacterium]|nr:MlaD family protein [Bacteroidota bacterium]
MKISREVKIGLIFIASIALFIYGFNFLKGRDVFKRERSFYAVYPSVVGLVKSSPVFINGLKVGIVKEVSFHPDGSSRVLVKMSVTNPIPIPSNSVARIFSSDLMGTKAIGLQLGNSMVMVKPGDTLLSDIQATLQEEVNRQVLPLKIKAEALMGSIDSAITVIRYVFNEETRENLEKSFLSIKQTIQNLESTTYVIDTLVSKNKGRVSNVLLNIESITSNLKNNNQNLTRILTNFSNITDTIARANITHTFDNLNKTLQKTADIMEKVNRGEGSVGQFMNNETLYKELEKSSRDLDLLLEDIRLRPDRYLHFSVFGTSVKKNQYTPPAGK